MATKFRLLNLISNIPSGSPSTSRWKRRSGNCLEQLTVPNGTGLCFVVKDRKAETLLPIIRKYVKPGTIIFSDSWSAYYRLDGEFKNFVVVHKRRFV